MEQRPLITATLPYSRSDLIISSSLRDQCDTGSRVHSNKPGKSSRAAQDLPPRFKFANWNVLFWDGTLFTKIVTRPDLRYPYLAKFVSTLDLELIGFNEACPAFEEKLMTALNSNGRDWTYISDSTKNRGQKHYSSILSFIPVIEAYSIDLPNMRRHAVATLVVKGGVHYVVCTTHLLAMANKRSRGVRRMQLQHLYATLSQMGSPLFRSTVAQGHLVIMGDFNLHDHKETKVIYENDLADCWNELRGEEHGATWDGRNAWWLPFDDRQMRLDRIVVPKKSHLYRPIRISIFGNLPIPGTSTFPSDHYALEVELEPLPTDMSASDGYTAKPYHNGTLPPRFIRSFRDILIRRCGCLAVGLLLPLTFLLRARL